MKLFLELSSLVTHELEHVDEAAVTTGGQTRRYPRILNELRTNAPDLLRGVSGESLDEEGDETLGQLGI